MFFQSHKIQFITRTTLSGNTKYKKTGTVVNINVGSSSMRLSQSWKDTSIDRIGFYAVPVIFRDLKKRHCDGRNHRQGSGISKGGSEILYYTTTTTTTTKSYNFFKIDLYQKLIIFVYLLI